GKTRQGVFPQVVAHGEPKRHLPDEFVFLDEAGVLPPRKLLFELEIIVQETNRTHPRHADHSDQNVAVVETCPEKSADECRPEDDQAAHRWRSALLLVSV